MERPSAFALVTALALMAFVLLLLVSLASVIRVETETSASSQQIMESRQNALYGLNMALAELQKNLGPDQRISAPSSLGGTNGANPNLPYFTGVWRQSTNAASTLAERTYSPELLTWLVSGNEGLAPTDSEFVTPETLEASYASPPPEMVWLVGTNSVLASATGDPDPRILAPKVDVGSRGAYAWWVGDEGTKARIDLKDPFAPGMPLANAANRSRSMQTARFDTMSGLDPLLPVINSNLQERLLSPSLLFGDPALFSDIDVNLGDLESRAQLRKTHFHNLTSHSQGLFTDTRNGGLRRDLSYFFALNPVAAQQVLLDEGFSDITAAPDISTSAGASNQLVIPGTTVPTWMPEFARPAGNRAIGPTWEQLHSFANLYKDLTPAVGIDGNDLASYRVHGETSHGLAPVLVQAKLFFGLRREPSTTVAGQFDIFVHYYPLFVLANPYTVDIAAGAYHASFYFIGPGATGSPANAPFLQITGSPNVNVGRQSRLHSILFRLSVTQPIPAGGAVVLSLEYEEPDNDWEADTESYAYAAGATYRMVDDFSENVSIREKAPGTFSAADSQAAMLRISGQTLYGCVLWDGAPSDASSVIQVVGVESSGAQAENVTPALGSSVGFIQRGGGYTYRWFDQRDWGGDNLGNGIFGELNMRAIAHKPSQGTASPDGQARTMGLVNGRVRRTTRTFFYGTNGWLTVRADNRTVPWLLNHQIHSGVTSLLDRIPAFHVPRGPLNSLAQLSHFNPAGFLHDGPGGFTGAAPPLTFTPPGGSAAFYAQNSFAYQPPYAIGNSKASKHVGSTALVATSNGTYADVSYLLNSVLWDRFFLSSYNYDIGGPVDFADSERLQINKRYRAFPGTLPISSSEVGFTTAAERLGNVGAFNVNSVSVDAWKAVLSGLRGAAFGGETNPGASPFARSEFQTSSSLDANSGIAQSAWSGFRMLSDADLGELAARIVDQVESRGPFLSLSDFVNRRVAANAADELGFQGALAAAISATAINNGVTAAPFRERPPSKPQNVANTVLRAPHLIVDFPGWLTQADILQPLGPSLTARSDTFVVRAYGEVQNPVSGQPISQSWCEAIVQRKPDFVDETQSASTSLPELNNTNRELGRRFEVVSFRWLNPDEI